MPKSPFFFLSSNVVYYNGYEEVNTLINKIGIQTAEILVNESCKA